MATSRSWSPGTGTGAIGTAGVSLVQTAARFAKQARFPFDSIVDFVTAPFGLNQTTLFPAQRFFLKVFEKEELDDSIADICIRDQFNETVLYRLSEQGYYQYLRDNNRFSLDYATYLNTPITQLHLSMGRRASKSTMTGMWVATKLAQLLVHDQPQMYFGILPTDPMNVSLTALGESNAVKLFGKLASMLMNAPYFRPFLLEPPGVASLKIWTRHDVATIRDKQMQSSDAHTHSINITAQANTPSVRGENNIFCVLEEFAHFNQSHSKAARDERQLDAIIYEALQPSVSGFVSPDGTTFGKILIITSPNGRVGKSWEEFNGAFVLGERSYTLAMAAPTWEVNPLVAPAHLHAAYNKSPTSYAQEYGAELLEGGVSWLRDLGKFYLAGVKGTVREPVSGRVDRTYYIGIDFALSRDATAIAIAHYEPTYFEQAESLLPEALAYATEAEVVAYVDAGHRQQKYVVDYVGERFAGKFPFEDRKVLLIDEILDWIDHLFKVWPIAGGIADQWAGAIIADLLAKRGYARRIEMVNHTEAVNDSLAKLFSELVHSGRLKLPDDKAMRSQLLGLQVEHRPHEIIRVEAPPGAHDDAFSAITRALWVCHAAVNKNFVIAGQKVNLKLGPGVERGVSSSDVARDEFAYRKMQQARHQTDLSLRNPKGVAARHLIMSQGLRRGS